MPSGAGEQEGGAGPPVVTRRRPSDDEIYGHQAYRNSVISVATYELVPLFPDSRHPSRALVVIEAAIRREETAKVSLSTGSHEEKIRSLPSHEGRPYPYVRP